MVKMYFMLDGTSGAEIISPETNASGYRFRGFGPNGTSLVQYLSDIQNKKGTDWMEEYIYKHARYDPESLESSESLDEVRKWLEPIMERGKSTQRQEIREKLEEEGMVL